jgi:hypothetical protein
MSRTNVRTDSGLLNLRSFTRGNPAYTHPPSNPAASAAKLTRARVIEIPSGGNHQESHNRRRATMGRPAQLCKQWVDRPKVGPATAHAGSR